MGTPSSAGFTWLPHTAVEAVGAGPTVLAPRLSRLEWLRGDWAPLSIWSFISGFFTALKSSKMPGARSASFRSHAISLLVYFFG